MAGGLAERSHVAAALQVHARGKQIPRDDDDAFLKEVALQTTGFSGAALANLMNEAAILQVSPCQHVGYALGRLMCSVLDV